MSTPTPADVFARRNGQSADDALTSLLTKLTDQVAALTQRVERLERSGRQAPRDELDERILEFLNAHLGMRTTALTVAENIGEDNSKVGHRLASLANRGAVKTSKETGRTRMYWAE